jgi:hypothetical protein
MHIAIAMLLLSLAPAAWGCSCLPQTLDDGFATATAVFAATVVSNDIPREIKRGQIESKGRAKLQVDRVWKSDGGKIDVVMSSPCGYYLEPGKTYVVFAGRYSSASFWSFLPLVYGDLYVDSCSLTTGTHFWDDCDLYPGPCRSTGDASRSW